MAGADFSSRYSSLPSGFGALLYEFVKTKTAFVLSLMCYLWLNAVTQRLCQKEARKRSGSSAEIVNMR